MILLQKKFPDRYIYIYIYIYIYKFIYYFYRYYKPRGPGAYHTRGFSINSNPDITVARPKPPGGGNGNEMQEIRVGGPYSRTVDTSDETNGGSETSRTESQMHETGNARASHDTDQSHSPHGATNASNPIVLNANNSELLDILVHQLKQDDSVQKEKEKGDKVDSPKLSTFSAVDQVSPTSVQRGDDATNVPESQRLQQNEAVVDSDKLAGAEYMTLQNPSVSDEAPSEKHFVSEVHMVVNKNKTVEIDADGGAPTNIKDGIYINHVTMEPIYDPIDKYFSFTDSIDYDSSPESDNEKVVQLPISADSHVDQAIAVTS